MPLPFAPYNAITLLLWRGECSCVNCVLEHVSAYIVILILAGTAGAGRMAPTTSTLISARLTRVQEHSSPVSTWPGLGTAWPYRGSWGTVLR